MIVCDVTLDLYRMLSLIEIKVHILKARRRKGWDYVAVFPPVLKVLHRFLIFTVEIFSIW